MQAPRAEGRPLGEKEFSGAACGKWAQDCDTPTPIPAGGAPPRRLLRVRPWLPREGVLPVPVLPLGRARPGSRSTGRQQAGPPGSAAQSQLWDRGTGPAYSLETQPLEKHPGEESALASLDNRPLQQGPSPPCPKHPGSAPVRDPSPPANPTSPTPCLRGALDTGQRRERWARAERRSPRPGGDGRRGQGWPGPAIRSVPGKRGTRCRLAHCILFLWKLI